MFKALIMGDKWNPYRKINSILIDKYLLFVILLIPVIEGFGQMTVHDSVTDSKLCFLKSAIKIDHQRTERWWYGWLGAYSAATLGQGVVYFACDNKSTRQDMALGAVTTILGAAGQFISPFMPNKEFIQFSSLPENSEEEKLLKLSVAEKLLSQWGEKERKALTWQNHILSTVVNIGGGMVTWLGFKRTWKDGLINFAMNTAITETQIWIQPTYAKRYYKKYCRQFLTDAEPYSYIPEVNCYLETLPGGIALRITF